MEKKNFLKDLMKVKFGLSHKLIYNKKLFTK